jgi:hypothetical protein
MAPISLLERRHKDLIIILLQYFRNGCPNTLAATTHTEVTRENTSKFQISISIFSIDSKDQNVQDLDIVWD